MGFVSISKGALESSMQEWDWSIQEKENRTRKLNFQPSKKGTGMVFALPLLGQRAGGGVSDLLTRKLTGGWEASQFLKGWDPNVVPGLVLYYLFDFAVNLFQRVSLYNGWKTTTQNQIKFSRKTAERGFINLVKSLP